MEDRVISERIDRNGTRHQEVLTNCDRCGGAGHSNAWKYTGYTCFKCGGSGKMVEKRKIYTPEHLAKLEKRREVRRKKKEEQIKAQAHERNKEYLENIGYDKGKIYVVLGDTYEIKDQLKEQGARFSKQIRGWYFSIKKDDLDVCELDVEKLVGYDESGQVYVRYDAEVKEYIRREIVKAEKELYGESEYVGKVGERLDLDLEVIKVIRYDYENIYTFDTSTIYINKLRDDKGNIFIWKTGRKNLNDCKNKEGRVKLRGTVKEHSEYEGVKQTILTRCKVVEDK